MDQGLIDKSYNDMATRFLPAWMEQATSDDPDSVHTSRVVLRYLQGYGTMVVESQVGKRERPSKETDFATLGIMADPNFATVVTKGTTGLKKQKRQDILSNMLEVISSRFVEQIIDDEVRIRDYLLEPDLQFGGTADEYGAESRFDPGPGFVRGEFARYIEAQVDPKSRTVKFVKRPNAPEYNRLTDRVIEALNDMDPQDNQIMASLAMAWAHAQGIADERAYNAAFKQMLGIK
jgi:hypothetical protein